jgi:hypothetical protein
MVLRGGSGSFALIFALFLLVSGGFQRQPMGINTRKPLVFLGLVKQKHIICMLSSSSGDILPP